MELHGGNIHKIAKELNIRKEDIIDFSSNINPLGISQRLREELMNNLDIIQSYPDPDYTDLRTLLSSYNNTGIEHILVGNGATELIYLFARAIKPATALIVSPAFVEYSLALAQAGTRINYFRLNGKNDFVMNAGELKAELKNSYDLLIMCNPNNPTSTYLKPDVVEDIVSFAGKCGSMVMLDESFVEFVDPGFISLTNNLYSKHRNLFLLRSLTKFFAIPGLRLGYSVSFSDDLLAKLRKNQEPWTVNQIAELAASVLISDREYIKKTSEHINNERLFMHKELGRIPWLKTYYPNANFFLLEILNSRTSHELKAELLQHGLLIRDASNFKYLNNKFVRIAIKDRKSNEALLNRLMILTTDEHR